MLCSLADDANLGSPRKPHPPTPAPPQGIAVHKIDHNILYTHCNLIPYSGKLSKEKTHANFAV